jgi:chromosome segregation ATPase
LQNALSESESRASDLDEQLKRKRAPKNRLEEQLDVLTHRLDSVEAERQRWEQQAGHLEEVAEAERVKVAQLKKKLEIAESGPEKLTKKEINFWKQKSEEIDTQIKEYQERLANVRRELNERDALIEKLSAAGGAAQAAPPAQESASDDEMRRQLEQRDEWLAELRLELHELRAEPAPPLETQAEVETLRSKITGLERALGEAQNLRSAAQSDLMRMQHEIGERERAIREAIAAGERERAVRDAAATDERERAIREAATAAAAERERAIRDAATAATVERERALREAAATDERARAKLMEREHRIVELSAEVEHLRNDLRQRDEQQREQCARQTDEVATLTRDLEALRARLVQDRNDSAADRAALEIALHEREQTTDRQRQLLAANERDFEELRRQLALREKAAAEARRQLEEQHREVQARDRELADRQQQLRSLNEALAEHEQRFTSSTAELEHLRATVTANSHDLDSLRETLQNTHRELEQARTTLTANERELDSLRERLLASSRELDELRAERQRLEHVAVQAEAHAAATASEIEAAREQMSGLETELKEEREHAESLGELANERREHMTKLQEQVEEAEERYADANWRLGKSLHFERIVKRRKGLVLKLLEALRAKMKANVALKAGLDGLRTFKATAEMNQHKLLQRIDALKADLKEADETVKRHQGGTAAKEELTNAISRAAALEERLNAQAELIQSLEADLKKVRLAHKPADDKSHEIERLTKELETKNQVIAALEADTDDQQRKLSKLRGTESETMRLRALTEKDRSEIETLQREIAQLRETLARQSSAAAAAAAAAASSNNADLEAKLKERENSVTRLMGTIKEHEAAIKRLTESSESWKRKYQFLASDQPDAYKGAAEK